MLEKTEKADKKEEYFMNEFAFGVVEKRIQRTIEALKKNAMDAFYVKTAAEVAPLAASLMPEGSTVACGGSANRIAALAYGPQNVLIVAGYNKIVPDLAAADARVRAMAAPANAARLACKTPCAVTGKCEDCHSPARICCSTLICAQQRVPGRIKVILVGEELGL